MMINKLIEEMKNNADSVNAEKMSAYMQNKFEFLGIPKPKLREIMKPYLKEFKKNPIDWEMIKYLWSLDFREYQYAALSYLEKCKKNILPDDIENLKFLIINKSWWETVDTIDAFVGIAVSKDEGLKDLMLLWAGDENMWLKRVAIDFQQEYKEKTDIELLEKIIKLNLNSDEFFINKAIGWSLRDYSKINPDWVLKFVEENKDNMAKLSIKEAIRLI